MNLLTKKQVAEILKVSERTVDRLRQENKLPSIRIRDAVRFDEADVKAMLEAARV